MVSPKEESNWPSEARTCLNQAMNDLGINVPHNGQPPLKIERFAGSRTTDDHTVDNEWDAEATESETAKPPRKVRVVGYMTEFPAPTGQIDHFKMIVCYDYMEDSEGDPRFDCSRTWIGIVLPGKQLIVGKYYAEDDDQYHQVGPFVAWHSDADEEAEENMSDSDEDEEEEEESEE